MMKLHRSALFAGLLAFAVVACGDDVQVVDPPPPPPPPLQVTLSPNSTEILVGQAADFSVGISGGAEGVQASISCESSNTSVATVTTTGQICRATGVAEGDASITVTVTKGTQTATAGAGLKVSVEPFEPATVAIEKVTQGTLATPVALNNVRRQVEVTMNIDPGTQVIQRLTLFFRGVEIASQTLGPATTAEISQAIREFGEDSPQAQQARSITFSWETDRYEIEAPVTGTSQARPEHLNGAGGLMAQLTVVDGTGDGSAVNSQTLDITLRNLNGFHLKIDETGSTRRELDVQGFEWRGGDAAGAQGGPGAGIDAHLVPVVYTPAAGTPSLSGPNRQPMGLQSAQFNFAGLNRQLSAAAGAWTYVWTAAALAGYTMPVPGTGAFPNMLRDGEYPRVVGQATLVDGQGMGPFGGALDCLGIATGILNVEVSPIGLACPAGTMFWNPPSAVRTADVTESLDPLRTGERLDNAGPTGRTFTMSSRPGFPDFPQAPATPAAGALVNPAGVWINNGYPFSAAVGGTLIDLGVSRAVAGFPAPTFGARIWQADQNDGNWQNLPASPTGQDVGDLFNGETATPTGHRARIMESDALDNRSTFNLSGALGVTVNFGLDFTNPIIAHNVGSSPDRNAFDLQTAGANAPLTTFYSVNWTDPVTVGASGFTSFVGNPVWRQVHRVVPAGLTAQVGGLVATNTSIAPVWVPGTGLANYGRTGASQQAVTGGNAAFGYYIYRAYVLDDAGNVSHDGTAANTMNPTGNEISYNSANVRRQAVIDPRADDPASGQPTVFGITAPVSLIGGSSVTFSSNAQDNLDLGMAFLSLDYPTFNHPTNFWGVGSGSTAAPPNTVGAISYWTPATTATPIQGTTGGVRWQNADFNIGVIFDTPFEQVSTLVAEPVAINRTLPSFVRSIEWLCSAAGTPHADCGAAPADWAVDISPQLATNVGWFPTLNPMGAAGTTAADAAYFGNRASTAAFAVYDATRWDPRTGDFRGNVNGVLEQIAPDDATSKFPNRSVAAAAINPVSVPLAAQSPARTVAVDAAGNQLQYGWAIRSVAAAAVTGPRNYSLTITARLISASSIAPGGPGQNIFPGPQGRVHYFILEPGTGTVRWLGEQMNPVLTENAPVCVTGGVGIQDQYRCWDFTNTFTVNNLVNAPSGTTVSVFAVGVNAAGDGIATYPVDITLP